MQNCYRFVGAGNVHFLHIPFFEEFWGHNTQFGRIPENSGAEFRGQNSGRIPGTVYTI